MGPAGRIGYALARPALFALDAERAHRLALAALDCVAGTPVLGTFATGVMAGAPVRALDAPDAVDRLEALARSDAPVRRVVAALAGRLVAAQGWDRLGYVRLRDYAVERLGLSARQVQDLAHVDRALRELPRVDAAFVAGEITWTKARLLCRVATAEDEAAWLELAKSLTARLPFERVDGLIVEWIGKEISGTGMDPAVVGRVGPRSIPDPNRPFVTKLAVLGVTEDSYGNAVGLGNADYTTVKVANHIDLVPMYMNSITAAYRTARSPV